VRRALEEFRAMWTHSYDLDGNVKDPVKAADYDDLIALLESVLDRYAGTNRRQPVAEQGVSEREIEESFLLVMGKQMVDLLAGLGDPESGEMGIDLLARKAGWVGLNTEAQNFPTPS
jgi:hypothetical protein